MAFEGRLIIDAPQPGALNMAIDESMLSHATSLKIPTLRFYLWERPTLSLGYFQKADERLGHSASRDCDWVRRNSGGGAIMHHHELTYSLTIPIEHEVYQLSADYYQIMHDSLIDCLAANSISAIRNLELVEELKKNFLCFQRRAPNDVLIDGMKVCGSAQRKRYQAIGQHGSIILKRSDYAPEIEGVDNLCDSNVEPGRLIEQLVDEVSKRLKTAFLTGELTTAEAVRANELVEEKYKADSWGFRR